MARFSLNQQIEEVAGVLADRGDEYSRRVASRKMGASLAAFQQERLAAALATLKWLQRHEATIRARCPEIFGGKD